MNWEFPATRQSPAITGEWEDGTTFNVDQWQLASAVTLLALWAKDGVLRLPASSWARAWEDVRRRCRWSVSLRLRPADQIVLRLHDTRRTEPSRVELIDLAPGLDGEVRASRSTYLAPLPWLGGDEGTATHLAIMLAMLRENDGVLAVRLDELAATADLIQDGYEWSVVEVASGGTGKTFCLREPPLDVHTDRLATDR